jgi:hypothetical protein
MVECPSYCDLSSCQKTGVTMSGAVCVNGSWHSSQKTESTHTQQRRSAMSSGGRESGTAHDLRTLHFLVSHRSHYLQTSLKINPRPRNSTRNFMGKTEQAPYIHSLRWPIFCCDYGLFGVRGSALSEHCRFHYLRIDFWYTCDMKKIPYRKHGKDTLLKHMGVVTEVVS